MKLHNATQRHFDLVKQNPKHSRTICKFSYIINQILHKSVDLSTQIVTNNTKNYGNQKL